MPGYVVFTKLTPEGRKRLNDDPSRLQAIDRQVERLGAKITKQFAVIGAYDFVTFVEAPSNEVLAGIGAEVASLGTMKLETYPMFSLDRFTQLVKMQPYRTEPHRWQTQMWARAFRRVGRYFVISRYVRQYCRPFDIEGRENLKDFRGAAIIIANHSSHFDTPVVLSALPERLRGKLLIAAAADKFYASRRKRTWWYSLFHGTFPVHRGGGVKQLEYPLSLFKRGWSILIYPEGGRSKTGQVQKFKAGPTIMAMQANVPVIPIWIEGLRDVMPKGQRTPRPAAVRARIGAPVWLTGAASVPEGTIMLENAMRELAGQPPRGAKAQQALVDAEAAPAPAGGS